MALDADLVQRLSTLRDVAASHDADAPEWEVALHALLAFDAARVLAAAIRVLDPRDQADGIALLTVLQHHADRAGESAVAQGLHIAERLLHEGPSPAVRGEALRTVSLLDTERGRLLGRALCASTEPEVRAEAARALGYGLLGSDDLRRVQALALDAEPLVRSRAAIALGSADDDTHAAAVDALEALLDDADPTVRRTAVESLATHGVVAEDAIRRLLDECQLTDSLLLVIEASELVSLIPRLEAWPSDDLDVLRQQVLGTLRRCRLQ